MDNLWCYFFQGDWLNFVRNFVSIFVGDLPLEVTLFYLELFIGNVIE